MSIKTSIGIMQVIVDPTCHFSVEDDPMRLERVLELIGVIPMWLESMPAHPAREAIDNNYAHGGGWFSMKGFTVNEEGVLSYPEDPDLYPIVEYIREGHDERCFQYEYGWVSVVDAEGNLDVARID